ncbi:MAG: hypothetical protein JKY51_01805 [Opitutaceae bacterium]|nr:hypothetical protein [Opitutaceae bacterium]
MKAIPKKYLMIGGGVVLAGLASFGIYKLIQHKKNPSAEKRAKKIEKELVAASVNVGSDGYVNVRSSPKVDNESWTRLDFTTNLLKKETSSPVGTIEKRVKGADGYFWYKLQLEKAIGGKSTGYVREDAVEISK